MSTVTTIYTLADPRTGKVRYVGKTATGLRSRVIKHLQGKCSKAVRAWLSDLVAAGSKPVATEIEIVEGAAWAERERYWIGQYRAAQGDLLNLAEGGEGPAGYRHTEDARRRIGAGSRAWKRGPGTIAKMRSRSVSDETRAKISAAKRAQKRVISEEQKAQIRKALTGRRPTEETRAKLRARTYSAAYREAASERARAQWAARKGCSQ